LKKPLLVIVIILISCSLFTFDFRDLPVYGQTNEGENPSTKANGTKWQLAYCESESFGNYTATLVGIVKGLAELGWVTDLDGFESIVATNSSQEIWQYLASREVSPYLEFVDNAFYNLKSAEGIDEKILERLSRNKDIDLILVMGTRGGLALANNRHDTKTLVFGASNAVRSGIIKSEEDSGLDHVWAHTDLQRFERQIKVMYDIVNFKKLGLVYEDSEVAKVYSAVSEVEKLAQEKGFEIVRYYVNEPINEEGYPLYYQQVGEAYGKLAQQVDAMYVTVASLDPRKLPGLLEPFYQKRIPVFSQLGEIEVEHGAMLTVSVMDEVNLGRYGAKTIADCLQGARPRSLEQLFQSSPKLILNLEVLKRTGFKIPYKLLMVVDRVYPGIAR
jgi:ABC-type uncharacterized transport system substrate-binding protein